MANQSTTGFGLRPIAKIGQNDNNAGLSEWIVAASSAIMYHHDMVMLTGDGVILASSITSVNNLGSLNGVFYTDASTSKPTWANYSVGSNSATDIVALVNSDPHQIFEIRTASSTPVVADVGGTAPIVATAGSAINFVSGFTMSGTVGTSADQLKLLGVSFDEQNQDPTVAGCIWRVQIYEHILGNICAQGI
jgi:hypothetical protein